MPKETIHYRIEYKNRAIYHIIASSDVEKGDAWDKYFETPFKQKNGVASLFLKSDGAPALNEKEKNIYVPDGDAEEAAEKLINRISKKNNVTEPEFKTRY